MTACLAMVGTRRDSCRTILTNRHSERIKRMRSCSLEQRTSKVSVTDRIPFTNAPFSNRIYQDALKKHYTIPSGYSKTHFGITFF